MKSGRRKKDTSRASVSRTPPAASQSTRESGFSIDFDVDSEWSKCIYSDCDKDRPAAAAACSRNNSSISVSAPPSQVDRGQPTAAPDYVGPGRSSASSSQIDRGGPDTPAVNRDFEFQSEAKNVQEKKQERPESSDLLSSYHKDARLLFESKLRRRDRSVNLSLCVRKHNYENYLWHFVREGPIGAASAYDQLHLWTVFLRVRMHRRVTFGCLMRGIQSRFGLRLDEPLKFCLDGFYGMPDFGDAFGNRDDNAVPWMEISTQSTADSLHLRDGDIIFVSCSNEKLENLARARKQQVIAGRGTRESQLSISSRSLGSQVPVLGETEPLMPHQSHNLHVPRPQRVTISAHSSQPLSIAMGNWPSAQFSQTVINCNTSNSPVAANSSVFSPDGGQLAPGGLGRLLQLAAARRLQPGGGGAACRVRLPRGCGSGDLVIVLTPELLSRVLEASAAASLRPLLPVQKARAFGFDAELLLAADAGAAAADFVELHQFADELDARLRRLVDQQQQQQQWTHVASLGSFVLKTFFSAALTTVYGSSCGCEDSEQLEAADAALGCLDESLTAAAAWALDDGGGEGGRGGSRVARARELLAGLHPSAEAVSAAAAAAAAGGVSAWQLRRMADRFTATSASWQDFVGYNTCYLLYDDFMAKRAAFWAINYILSHRNVYGNLLAEIDEFATKAAHHDRADFGRMTLGDIEKMPFLEAFVKEVLRHASGQLLRFQAMKRVTLRAGDSSSVACEKGSLVGVLLRALNMSPDFFHKPEAFRPERFLALSQDASQLCLPLGAMPPRRRMGLLKVKLFIVQLLSRISLRPAGGSTARPDDCLLGPDVLPSSKEVAFQYRARGRS